MTDPVDPPANDADPRSGAAAPTAAAAPAPDVPTGAPGERPGARPADAIDDAGSGAAAELDERIDDGIAEVEVIEVVEAETRRGEPGGARIFDLRPARAADPSVARAAATEPAAATVVETVARSRRGGPLAGRVAVVTGASGATGRAVAVALSAAGARVCALGRDLAALRQTADAAPGPVVHLQCDIGSVSEIEGVVDFIERLDRPVDLLVHAEGVLVRGGVEHGSVNDLDEQYLVNVRGPYLLSQRLLPPLRAGDGHVVLVRSEPAPGARQLGQHAIVGRAVEGLAEELRREAVPSGMRVTTIVAEVDDDAGAASTDALADEVADAVLAAVTLSVTAELADVRLRLAATERSTLAAVPPVAGGASGSAASSARG